ncbi:MAG: hypothetical protein U0401_31490 [Anaerolineae bacterium]
MRWLEMLRPGGTVIAINRQHLPPVSTVFGTVGYPTDEEVLARLSDLTDKVFVDFDAVGIADRLNNRRVANSVLLGVLSSVMETPLEAWLTTLVEKVLPGTRA